MIYKFDNNHILTDKKELDQACNGDIFVITNPDENIPNLKSKGVSVIKPNKNKPRVRLPLGDHAWIVFVKNKDNNLYSFAVIGYGDIEKIVHITGVNPVLEGE